MNFTFKRARLLAPVAALCLVVLLTLSVNAEIIERAYNSTEEAVVGANDILIIKGNSNNDNAFSYNNYSGSGVVYFNPSGYSYFTTTIPDGYTNTKIFIAGNALGLQSSKTSSDVYGSERILVLTNELPTTTGTTTVKEGTLFNANGSSPTYDNPIQIKGVGGLRVGWSGMSLTVSGKISDYTDANGNVTPGKLIIERDGSDIRITNWDNDYSGGTQIGGGNVTSGSGATTLTIQTKPDYSTGTTPLGTGPIYFGSDNSKLDMKGYTLTISAIDNQKESGGNYSGNTVVNNADSLASPTFNAAEGANFVYTGSLPKISGTLTKNGKGSQSIVTADIENVNVTEGTMGFSGALTVSGNVSIASGATLKMTGTGAALNADNQINIQDGATLYFENAVPHNDNKDLAINIAQGGTLKFSETDTGNHNDNNSLVRNASKNVTITGDGSFVKTGTGKLFITNQDNDAKVAIVLSDTAVIDVQEGDLVNGGWSSNCWKYSDNSAYNQATLNIGPNGTVDLWDGTLHVGGITGDIDDDNHGLIKSTNNGHIVVGMGMNTEKTFVYNGNVDLNSGRSFTKEGATTQAIAGTFSNLGTTNVNGGTLELSGTTTLATTNINNASLELSGMATLTTTSINGGTLDISGTATLATINFSNNGKIDVIQNGVATLTKEINFAATTPINVASTATLILDPGDEKINAQTYTDNFKINGTVIVKSGYFRTVKVSDATAIELDGGTLQNNGNNTGTSTSDINTNIYLTSDSRIMAGWSGRMNVNGVISGPSMLIIRDDSGVVYLYKSNTYTGGTQVGDSYKTNPAARLVAVTTNVLGTGRLYFGKAGASFDMAGYAQTIGGLGKDMNANETQYSGSVNNSGAETTLTINVPEGETYNFNGSVANNVNIVKNGEGTQQFNIANLANAELFSDSIVVNAGRLDMKEFFVGTLEVESDGVFSPGNSVGTLNLTGDLNLNGGTLLMEIEGPTEADSDQLIIDGALNLNDGNIVLDFVNGMAPNEEFAVVLHADNITDPDDVLSLIDSSYFSYLRYENGSGQWVLSGKIDANAVPEPSAWALLILSAAGLMYWRKRS